MRNKCFIFENDTGLLFLSRLPTSLKLRRTSRSSVPPLQGHGEKLICGGALGVCLTNHCCCYSGPPTPRLRRASSPVPLFAGQTPRGF